MRSISLYQYILYIKHGYIARITLNRPHALNVVNGPLLREMNEALRDAARDDAIAVVVLTGAGERAFCAGADLKEQQVRGGSWSTEARNVRAANRVRAFPGRHDTDSFRCARSP